MAIYEKPVRLLMRQMVTELPVKPGESITKETVLNWFATRYPKIKEGTMAAHLIRLSTNARTRVHYSAKPDDDVFFQIDGSHFRLYEPAADPPPIYANSAPEPPSESGGADEDGGTGSQVSSEFAYETGLRNFLSKNLSIVEHGLRLYEEEGGVNGIEFPAGGRFIDILAVDVNSNYVVIELKVSRGYDRVCGPGRSIYGVDRKEPRGFGPEGSRGYHRAGHHGRPATCVSWSSGREPIRL